MVIIDIVFQTGEFINPESGWWQDLLNTILGAGIGSGFTVWALYRTFRQDKIINDKKQDQFQKEKIQYLQSLVTTIFKNLKIQIGYYIEFSKKIKQNPYDIPLLEQTPFNELSQIVHKINQEEYYHSYLRQFGTEKEIINEFSNIISLLNYFESNIILNQEIAKKVIEFDYERKTKLKDLVEKSMDSVAGYLRDDQIKQDKTEFWNFLNKVTIKFHSTNTDNADLKFYFENYVEVIKLGLIDFVEKIPEAHYLIVQMKQATFLYSEIHQQNIFAVETFENVSKDMDEYHKKLEPIIKRLLEHKP